jgi:hypothetical protein
MGGTISVTSKEGHGSEFAFTARLEAAPEGTVIDPVRRTEGDDVFAAIPDVEVPATDRTASSPGPGYFWPRTTRPTAT